MIKWYDNVILNATNAFLITKLPWSGDSERTLSSSNQSFHLFIRHNRSITQTDSTVEMASREVKIPISLAFGLTFS